MFERMSEAHQRRLAVALLATIVAAVLSVTALPAVLANASYQREIVRLQGQLLRLRDMAEHDEELRRQYAELRRAQSSRGYFLKGDSEAVASADLQRIIKGIAAANGTQLLSTQILPANSENELTRISLRVRVQGPLTGVIESLYALESNSVLLFLDNLSLRTAESRRLLRAVQDQRFEAQFDLVAYVTETT